MSMNTITAPSAYAHRGRQNAKTVKLLCGALAGIQRRNVALAEAYQRRVNSPFGIIVVKTEQQEKAWRALRRDLQHINTDNTTYGRGGRRKTHENR